MAAAPKLREVGPRRVAQRKGTMSQRVRAVDPYPSPPSPPPSGRERGGDWRRASITFLLACAIIAAAGSLSVAYDVAPDLLTGAGAAALLAAAALAAWARLRHLLRRVWLAYIWTAEVLAAVISVAAGYGVAAVGIVGPEVGPFLALAVVIPATSAPLRWGVAFSSGLGVVAGYLALAPPTAPPVDILIPAVTAGLLGLGARRAARSALGEGAGPAKGSSSRAIAEATDIDAPRDSLAEINESVLQMATSFTSASEPGEIAARIAQSIVDQLRATGAVLLLWNEVSATYRIGAVRGQDVPGIRDILEVEVTSQSIPVLDPATVGRAVPLPALGFSEPVLRSLLRRWRGTQILGVQLRRNEKDLGLLIAVRGEAEPDFDANDREIASAVSMHAASALAHAASIAELENANALKEEFMATMSHELRTPLNVIIGYTDLQLEDAFGALEGEHRSTLETVRGQAIQLLELIQATLDMSRLERGLVQVDLTDLPIANFLEDLKRVVPPSWRKPGVELRWNIQTGLPMLRTDPSKLQMLLRNLVHNALKFTQHGVVSVSVSSDPTRRHVTFVVQDSGVGIAAEHLSEIFEMFRQGPDGKATTGGVGLGLYIVKRLAELLGAEIEVSSAPGRGATFRINVPFDGPLVAHT